MKLDKGNWLEYQIFYGKKTIFWEEKFKNSWTSFQFFNYHLKGGFFIFLYFCTILLLLTLQQIPMRSKQPKVECCHSLDIISAIFLSPEHMVNRSTGEFLINKFNVWWLRRFLAWHVLWLQRSVMGCLVVGSFILGRLVFFYFFPLVFLEFALRKRSLIWDLAPFKLSDDFAKIFDCKL